MKVLITGASGGIGLEIAKLMAANNYQLTLVARSKEKLKEAVDLLDGSSHQYIVADLSAKEGLDDLKAAIKNNKYDVFINNAGFGKFGRFTDMPLDEQEKMMNLNMKALTVLSYFYLSQARRGDALVNIASVVGTTSNAGYSVYAGTKAYVTIFSESLWAEYKNKGIYVCAFCPGVTRTKFFDVAGASRDSYPKFIVQSPERVAQELLKALKKRNKPTIVSGFINRTLLRTQRLMTRKMVASMMAGSFQAKD